MFQNRNKFFLLKHSYPTNNRDKRKGTNREKHDSSLRVLEAGLEPAQPQWPKDFKSFVSTIPPFEHPMAKERKTRLELATLTLARLCSTN